MKFFGLNGSQEPTLDQIHDQQGRRPSTVEVVEQQVRRKSVDNRVVTGASGLTTRQSIVPVTLVTILFFMWGKSPNSLQTACESNTDMNRIRIRSPRCFELPFPGRSAHHPG